MIIQINRILGINKLQYINFVDQQFNLWCLDLSTKHYVPMREFQKSPKLYNWFLAQWDSRVIATFITENNDFLKNGVEAPKVYFDFLINILNNQNGLKDSYPSIIVKSIKKEHYKSINNAKIT